MIATEAKPPWLLKHLPLLKDNPGAFFAALARDHGELVYLPLGKRRFYLINDADLVRDLLITHGASFEKFPRIDRTQGLFGDGLLTSEEPLHMKQRRLIQPGFHRDRIRAYGSIMADCALRATRRWPPGETIDFAAEMNHLALDIVSRTLFSTSTESEAEEIARELEVVLHMLNRIVMPLGGLRLRIPLPATRRYFHALDRLNRIIYRIIDHRRGAPADDLLQMLLEQGMDPVQLRDEVMTLFVAGHDTTANALAWTFYLLTQHPGAYARLEAEVDSVLGRRLATADDYPSLPFTERVFSESMRLFPAVWILGRRALQPVEFANGFRAEPGSILLVCMQVLHRWPRYHPDPDRFDPDRWATPPPKYSYLPFGAGSRLCVGERFAWMEGVLSIATLVQQCRFSLVPGQSISPLGLLTLRPKHGLRFAVKAR